VSQGGNEYADNLKCVVDLLGSIGELKQNNVVSCRYARKRSMKPWWRREFWWVGRVYAAKPTYLGIVSER